MSRGIGECRPAATGSPGSQFTVRSIGSGLAARRLAAPAPAAPGARSWQPGPIAGPAATVRQGRSTCKERGPRERPDDGWQAAGPSAVRTGQPGLACVVSVLFFWQTRPAPGCSARTRSPTSPVPARTPPGCSCRRCTVTGSDCSVAPATLITTSLTALRVWMALPSGVALFLLPRWCGLRQAWVLARPALSSAAWRSLSSAASRSTRTCGPGSARWRSPGSPPAGRGAPGPAGSCCRRLHRSLRDRDDAAAGLPHHHDHEGYERDRRQHDPRPDPVRHGLQQQPGDRQRAEPGPQVRVDLDAAELSDRQAAEDEAAPAPAPRPGAGRASTAATGKGPRRTAAPSRPAAPSARS